MSFLGPVVSEHSYLLQIHGDTINPSQKGVFRYKCYAYDPWTRAIHVYTRISIIYIINFLDLNSLAMNSITVFFLVSSMKNNLCLYSEMFDIWIYHGIFNIMVCYNGVCLHNIYMYINLLYVKFSQLIISSFECFFLRCHCYNLILWSYQVFCVTVSYLFISEMLFTLLFQDDHRNLEEKSRTRSTVGNLRKYCYMYDMILQYTYFAIRMTNDMANLPLVNLFQRGSVC